ENLRECGSRPCLINAPTGDVYSYHEVDSTARKVARGLKKEGVEQGQVIMILLPNCPEFVFSFLGASHRGAMATAANPFLTPAEIAKQAHASNAKLLITQASYYDKVKDLRHIKLVFVDSCPPQHLHFSQLCEDNGDADVDIKPDDVVALPYSSGTTGLPKGVMLSHK
ncbi:AMP-binding protein, partial [Vibrio parahaemolyticus]|nr:AMP-binding protein [Vibrio parahaemolyticus]